MSAAVKTVESLVGPPVTEETVCYDLVLLHAAGTHILLRKDSDHHILPSVTIPRLTRPAERITSALRTSWNLRTVLLWSCEPALKPEMHTNRQAVLEVIDQVEETPTGLCWVAIDEGVDRLEPAAATLIQSSHARAFNVESGMDPEPFSRLGWMSCLKAWVKGVAQPAGVELRDFMQLNGSETFSLVRFDTNSNPLWFKAVGVPNLHEFPITMLLSRLFPDYLPRILASDPLLNGWLMESGGAVTLRDCDQLESWTIAVKRFAELQIESIGKTAELLQAGCADLRIERLASLVSPFFEVMADLMAQQIKSQPLPLSLQELAGLAARVKAALSSMADVGIPDTLGHGDFNPGNILVDGHRTVFGDWAEAHVGPAVFTFEYFLAHVKKSSASLVEHEASLRAAYVRRWQSVTSARKIQRALDLSPLVAAFAHAVSGGAWCDPNRVAVPQVAAFLRSLTRRMKYESELLRSRTGAASAVFDPVMV